MEDEAGFELPASLEPEASDEAEAEDVLGLGLRMPTPPTSAATRGQIAVHTITTVKHHYCYHYH